MKTIQLTRGYEAIVDDEDYEELSKYKWCASSSKYSRNIYAVRTQPYGPRSERKSKTIRMQKIVLNVEPNIIIDHINGNGLDNRKENLRICSSKQNNQNRRQQIRVTTSKYKGVTWHKQRSKWAAQIQVNRKHISLGLFVQEIEAALAYNEASIKYFGEYAKLNIIDK